MSKEKDTSKKPVVKDKKRASFKKYFRGVVSEVKKVSWPSRKELTNTTMVVLAFIVILSVVVGVIDLGLGELLKLITTRMN
ncbi:MAG: preprotein translocase subunit SecE [Caldicoprobacterales bacterium]|jgi:preprotein translocase subunit SecE|nr:preprotein translocase subunit SecE [Clostridiales bacterium]